MTEGSKFRSLYFAQVRDGDIIRIDAGTKRMDALNVDAAEFERRRAEFRPLPLKVRPTALQPGHATRVVAHVLCVCARARLRCGSRTVGTGLFTSNRP
jgi:hypothetical protein